jgi:hypothetical protein
VDADDVLAQASDESRDLRRKFHQGKLTWDEVSRTHESKMTYEVFKAYEEIRQQEAVVRGFATRWMANAEAKVPVEIPVVKEDTTEIENEKRMITISKVDLERQVQETERDLSAAELDQRTLALSGGDEVANTAARKALQGSLRVFKGKLRDENACEDWSFTAQDRAPRLQSHKELLCDAFKALQSLRTNFDQSYNAGSSRKPSTFLTGLRKPGRKDDGTLGSWFLWKVRIKLMDDRVDAAGLEKDSRLQTMDEDADAAQIVAERPSM